MQDPTMFQGSWRFNVDPFDERPSLQRVEVSGFRVEYSGFRLEYSGFRVGHLGFRVEYIRV